MAAQPSYEQVSAGGYRSPAAKQASPGIIAMFGYRKAIERFFFC